MNKWHTWIGVGALSALLLVGGTAQAASVTPIVRDGNITSCPSGYLGISTNSEPVNGRPYSLGGGQTITFTYQANPKFIDFSATIPIDIVYVKGSSNTNEFRYIPPVASDTGLFSPDNSSGGPAGVSHVVACFLPRPVASKTAIPAWERDTQWGLSKSANPTAINMFVGDSHDVQYTVTATPTTRNTFKVSGQITVSNPFGLNGVTVQSVADTMVFNGNATMFHARWPTALPADQGTMSCSDGAGSVLKTCSYSFELNKANYAFLVGGLGGQNAVAVVSTYQGNTIVSTGTASLQLPASPSPSHGDTLTVTDPKAPGPKVFNFDDTLAQRTWVYGQTYSCGQSRTENNTATGVFGTSAGPTAGSTMASASVAITCRAVQLTKTASTGFTRDYDWSVDKKIVVDQLDARFENAASCLADPIVGGPYHGAHLCEDAQLRLNPGGVYDTVYRLQATRTTQSESGFNVSGTITATWPASAPAPKFAVPPVQDTLHFSDATTQAVVPVCGAQGATSLACTYSATTPKLSGHNLASITRIKQCYTAAGVATDCGSQVIDSNQAAFAFGAPTVEIDACTDLGDAFNGGGLNLGPGFAWDVAQSVCQSGFTQFVTGEIKSPLNVLLGNLEIRADWIPPSAVEDGTCTFMVPNVLHALFNGQSRSDEAVVSIRVPGACVTGGCSYTQGYWKTHVNYAPKPQFSRKRDATWDLIDGAASANEDASFFGSGASYIKVMWTAPKGNAYYNLAHQYIAAKLNVLAGASDAAVATDLAAAEALFSAHAPGSNYWKNKSNSQNVIAMAGRLAAYNEGSIGPGHCSVSPANRD
ncbi:MAG: hypothetical protein M3485_02170 [Pseudomonadota bacterium]|nr:hypothetical protein [Pseudomonadota bacterium]